LLPNLKGNCNFIGLVTGSGNNSKYVGKKYSFNYCTNEPDEVLSDKNINTVFIATRHNLHAQYVIKALENRKNIFVEKPLCMNEKELEEISKLYQMQKTHLMVGFNRRFSPAIQKVKKIFSDDQLKSINIRVNAGILTPEHWVNDPEIGGGRIIGESCHFIDLVMYIAGSKIKSVYATPLNDSDKVKNTVNISLSFENGSIANISYFSNGSKKLPKEYIEIFSGGTVITIDDFKSIRIFSNSIKKIKFTGQDKGHHDELKQYIEAIKNGKPCPISFEDCYISMLTTFKALESIITGKAINIE